MRPPCRMSRLVRRWQPLVECPKCSLQRAGRPPRGATPPKWSFSSLRFFSQNLGYRSKSPDSRRRGSSGHVAPVVGIGRARSSRLRAARKSAERRHHDLHILPRNNHPTDTNHRTTSRRAPSLNRGAGAFAMLNGAIPTGDKLAELLAGPFRGPAVAVQAARTHRQPCVCSAMRVFYNSGLHRCMRACSQR